MSAFLFKEGLPMATEASVSRTFAREYISLIKERPGMELLDKYTLEQAALELNENADFCEECALVGITVIAPKSFGKEFAS